MCNLSVTLSTSAPRPARTVTGRGCTSRWSVRSSECSAGCGGCDLPLPRVHLHYHDYLLDGRWVVTADLDSDDTAAVVRNLGDGWDDEECPEKETYVWQLRSRRAPGAGNIISLVNDV